MSTLTYTASGTGPTVVLLHGFMGSRHVWQSFVPFLSTRHHVVVPDLPGFGESPAAGGDSVAAMADALHGLIEELSPGPFVLIGHSLGGYVALAYAERHPARLLGLGLFHSTAYADSDEKRTTRERAVAFIEKHGVAPYVAELVPPLFAPSQRGRLQPQMEEVMQVGRQTDPAAATAALYAMRNRPDRTHVLRGAAFPVLFVVGREDAALPFEAHHPQLLLPADVTIHVLSATAHMGMFEHPELTQVIIENFLRRCATHG